MRLKPARAQRRKRIAVAIRKAFYHKSPNIASLVYIFPKQKSLSCREKKWAHCFQQQIEEEYKRYHEAFRQASIEVLGEDPYDDYEQTIYERGTIRDYSRVLLQQETIL